MIFSSIFFLYIFLPVTLLVYYLVPMVLKNAVLLILSLVFYAWGEPVYVVLMIFSIVFNYISGLEIDYYKEQGNQKMMRVGFIFSVVVNFALLGFFKYYGFLVDNLNMILPFDIPYKELPLPIGISFYTFQTMSYVIDVYVGKTRVQKNIISFGAYVTMFPQLIAGPIVRYTDVEKQLRHRELSIPKFGDGVMWFLRGLGKKVLIANNIGMTFDTIAALPSGEMSVLSAWIGAIAYTIQIYFDFGGYSDMAIGLGKMLGFDFIKNFDYPYTSKSITEFWRRWHISLGSWFREYVYIPLGGNRVGTAKMIRNTFIVWGLTGFWHGASWNFIFWGLYYGFLLFLEKYLLRNWLERLPEIVKWLYSLVLVIIGWVFFFSPTLGSAFSYIGTMFGVGAAGFVDGTGLYYFSGNILLIIIAALCSTPVVYSKFFRFSVRRGNYRIAVSVAVYVGILLLSTAYLVNATYNPFLYFRF